MSATGFVVGWLVVAVLLVAAYAAWRWDRRW
jgi:hypothetical protein